MAERRGMGWPWGRHACSQGGRQKPGKARGRAASRAAPQQVEFKEKRTLASAGQGPAAMGAARPTCRWTGWASSATPKCRLKPSQSSRSSKAKGPWRQLEPWRSDCVLQGSGTAATQPSQAVREAAAPGQCHSEVDHAGHWAPKCPQAVPPHEAQEAELKFHLLDLRRPTVRPKLAEGTGERRC